MRQLSATKSQSVDQQATSNHSLEARILKTNADIEKATKLIPVPEGNVICLRYLTDSFNSLWQVYRPAPLKNLLILFTDERDQVYGAYSEKLFTSNQTISEDAYIFSLLSEEPIPSQQFTKKIAIVKNYLHPSRSRCHLRESDDDSTNNTVNFGSSVATSTKQPDEEQQWLQLRNVRDAGNISFHYSDKYRKAYTGKVRKISIFVADYVDVAESLPNTFKITPASIVNDVWNDNYTIPSHTARGFDEAIQQPINAIVADVLTLSKAFQIYQEEKVKYIEDLKDFIDELDRVLSYLHSIYSLQPYPLEYTLQDCTRTQQEAMIEDKIKLIQQIHNSNNPKISNPSDGSARSDPILYINAEGEKTCILKKAFTETFPKSSLTTRISGKWTEQSKDVDGEGYMLVYTSGREVKQLVSYAREMNLRKQLSQNSDLPSKLIVKRKRARVMKEVLDELCIDDIEIEAI